MNVRTARDWDGGVRKTSTSRTYRDGLRVDYAAGTATMAGVNTVSPILSVLDKQLHPRFLSLTEREQIRDVAGESGLAEPGQ
ncbi:hypothetical protein ABZV91_32090 [Nocardia sp. NPDC004568]|uniref:hypothetical protein n=1 Tax=Nocardia sp. NPDC004568 TaxID=3154551 RepID=UPI0033B45D97